MENEIPQPPPEYNGKQPNKRREYRVLAIAVVFFAFGAYFYMTGSTPPKTNGVAAINPAISVQKPGSQNPTQGLTPQFATFPAPSTFKTFSYTASGLNGTSTLNVNPTCNETYLTILIFPVATDYRASMSQATYDTSFSCEPREPFEKTFTAADMGKAAFGTYYMVIVDEDATGAWYNPR